MDKVTVTQAIKAMHRSELEAELVHATKLLERLRNAIGHVVLEIEDEGDRCYFGSTNDADTLRKVEEDMLASLNEIEMSWMHGDDLYETIKQLRDENAELKARLASQTDAQMAAPDGLADAINWLKGLRDGNRIACERDYADRILASLSASNAVRDAQSVVNVVAHTRLQWFCSGHDCTDYDAGRDEGLQLAEDAARAALAGQGTTQKDNSHG